MLTSFFAGKTTEDLEKILSQTKGSLRFQQGKIEALEKKILKLSEQKAEIETKESLIEKKEAEIQKLSKNLESSKISNRFREDNLKKLDHQNTVAERDFYKSKSDKQELSDTISTLKEENSRLEKILSEPSQQTSETTQAKRIEELLEQIRIMTEEKAEIISGLSGQIEELERRLSEELERRLLDDKKQDPKSTDKTKRSSSMFESFRKLGRSQHSTEETSSESEKQPSSSPSGPNWQKGNTRDI